MSASLNRRLLQVAAGLSAIHFLTGGGFYLWRGVSGLSLFTPSPLPIDVADPLWANIDYMFRALAGIWCVLGVMLAYIIPSIERQTAWFALIFLAVFAMGVGRLLSFFAFGTVPGNSTGAMVSRDPIGGKARQLLAASRLLPCNISAPSESSSPWSLWQRCSARNSSRGRGTRVFVNPH